MQFRLSSWQIVWRTKLQLQQCKIYMYISNNHIEKGAVERGERGATLQANRAYARFDVSAWRVKFHSILFSAFLSNLNPRVIYFTFVTRQQNKKLRGGVVIIFWGGGLAKKNGKNFFNFSQVVQKCNESQVKCLTCVNDTHINAFLSSLSLPLSCELSICTWHTPLASIQAPPLAATAALWPRI